VKYLIFINFIVKILSADTD